MSTPASAAPLSGVSGSAGISLSPDVKVDLQVAPQANSDIYCELDCNGKKVRVIYRASGETDYDTYPFEST